MKFKLFFVIFLIHTLVRAQDKNYFNFVMYKKTGPHEIALGLVGAGEKGDSMFFYSYVKKDTSFVVDTNQRLNIKIFKDTSFYELIRKGEKIDFAYIPILDFSKLSYKKNHTFYIDYNIDFSSCIIGEIQLPNFSHVGTIGIEDTIVFNKPVNLNYCTFHFNGEKIIFNEEVHIYAPISKGMEVLPFYFVNTIFRKKITFYPDLTELPIFIKKYIKVVSFNDRLQEFEFSHCSFDSIDCKIGLSYSDFNFENCNFNNYTSIGIYDTGSKLLFKNCIAHSYFYLDNLYKNILFESCCFKDTLNLLHVNFSDYTGNGFLNVSFKENATVLINPDKYDFKKLNFNFIAIQKINIPFIVESSDRDFLVVPMSSKPNPVSIGFNSFFIDKIDEEILDRSQTFYLNLQKEIQSQYDKQPDVVNSLTAKFQYQSKQYEIQYHKDQITLHGFTGFFTHSLSLIWLYLLELVVHNGYKGEWNFFITVLSVILTFAVVYFYFYRLQMISYFDELSIRPSYGKNLVATSSVKNFAKCFWFSSAIFISLKFQKKLFNLDKKIFFIVCFEWILGFFLMILYLVYIAIKYPFAKALLGL